MTVTTVITLEINVPFSEWVKAFDSDLAEERHAEFGIKPLYRSVSKEDPSKIVVIHQAPKERLSRLWVSMENGSQVTVLISLRLNPANGCRLK